MRLILLWLSAASAVALQATTPIPAQSQTLENRVARCAAHSSPVERLSCYDSLAKQLGLDHDRVTATSERGKWVVTKTVSPIDDSTTVVAGLPADSKITGWLESHLPTLIVRCREGTTSVYVTTGMTGAGDNTPVRLRFDEKQAEAEEWPNSTDGKAVFALRDDIEFARKIGQHDRLVFEITPFNASPTVTTFALDGAFEAISEVAMVCGWTLPRKAISDSTAPRNSEPNPPIEALQRLLSERGHYGGLIDGIFGPQTRDAIASYQRSEGLPATGKPDTFTLRRLGI